MALIKGIGKLLAGGARKTGRGAKIGTAAVVGGGLALGASSILGGLAAKGIMGMGMPSWPGGKGGGLTGATDPAAGRDSSIIAGMRPSDVIKKENIGKLKADADLPTALGWIAKAASAIYKTVYQNNREIIRVQEMLQGPVASRAKELRMESGGGAAPTVIMMGGAGGDGQAKDTDFPWWLPAVAALGTVGAMTGAEDQRVKPPRAGRNPRGSTPAERKARVAEIKEKIRLRNQRLAEIRNQRARTRMSVFDRISMEKYNADKLATEQKLEAQRRANAEKLRIEAERKAKITEGRNLLRQSSGQSMTDYRASETARQTTEQNRRIELTEDSRRSQGRQIAEAQAERQRVINEQNKYRSRTTNIKPGAQYLGEPATSRGLTTAESNLKGEIGKSEGRIKGTVMGEGTATRNSVGRTTAQLSRATVAELAKVGPTLEIMNRRLGGYGDALKIANKAFGMTQTGQTSIAETKAIETKIKGADKIGIKSGGYAGMLETFTATEKGTTKIGTVRTTVGSTSFVGEQFTSQSKGGIALPTGHDARVEPPRDVLGEKRTHMVETDAKADKIKEAKLKTVLEKIKARVPASWRGPLTAIANSWNVKQIGAQARQMPRGAEKWINRAMLVFLAGAFAWEEIRYRLAQVPGGFIGGPYGPWHDEGPNGEKVHWDEKRLLAERNRLYKELAAMLALVVGAWLLLGIAIDLILGAIIAGGVAIPGPGWVVAIATFAVQFLASGLIAEFVGRKLGILPDRLKVKETPDKIIGKRLRGYNKVDRTGMVQIGTGQMIGGFRSMKRERMTWVQEGGEEHQSYLADKSAGTDFGGVGASSSFLDFVADQEGFSETAYTDAAGVLTAGYGHTGSDVTSSTQVSEPEARRFLVKDIQEARRKAKSKVNGRFGAGTWEALPQHSKDMLTDIEFNVRGGLNTFQKFTKAVVTEDWETARKEFKRYYTDTSGEKKPLVKRNKDFFARFLEQAGAKQSATTTLTGKRDDLIQRFQDVHAGGYAAAGHTSGLTLGEYLIREIQNTQAAINALATVIPTLPPTRGGVGEDGGNATTVINVQGGNTTVQQATTNFQPWRSQLAIPGGEVLY